MWSDIFSPLHPAQILPRNVFAATGSSVGWILSIVFAAVYIIRSDVILLSWSMLVVTYVMLVLPLLTGLLSKITLVSYVRTCVSTVLKIEFWKDIGCFLLFVLDWVHFLYLQAAPIHPTVMQLSFSLAAQHILCPQQALASLYVQLFFSVIAHLYRSLQNRTWSGVHPAGMTLVRVGRCIVIIMVLFTISIQYSHVEPPLDYVVLTLMYYGLTQYRNEPFVVVTATDSLVKMRLHWLEGMEELVVPCVLDLTIVSMGVTFAALSLCSTTSILIIASLTYTNILVPVIQMEEFTWTPLVSEWQKIKRFPFALWNNPEIRTGGSCAICLDKLVVLSSRVTPCKHVFHGSCLRRSLHYTPWCPLCKTPL